MTNYNQLIHKLLTAPPDFRLRRTIINLLAFVNISNPKSKVFEKKSLNQTEADELRDWSRFEAKTLNEECGLSTNRFLKVLSLQSRTSSLYASQTKRVIITGPLKCPQNVFNVSTQSLCSVSLI